MTRDFSISLSPEDAAVIVTDSIIHDRRRPLIDTAPGVLLDDHRVECPSGKVVTLIFTKYYARVGSFVTLVVSIHNLNGQTKVHLATGGHKMWDDNVDLGASLNFIRKAENALRDYIL